VRKSIYVKLKRYLGQFGHEVYYARELPPLPDSMLVELYKPDIVVTNDKKFPFRNKVVIHKNKTDFSIVVKQIFKGRSSPDPMS